MTRRYNIGLFAPLYLALILGVTLSCGGSGDGPSEPAVSIPTSIAITPDSVSLEEVGETAQLSASVLDQNGQAMTNAFVWWISSESSVATVDETGLVTADGSGVASIMAGAGNAADTATVSVVTDPPLITPTTMATGVVGAAYSQSLAATGGNGVYVWSISAGALPAGLELTPDGTISGTPTVADTSTFTVQVASAGQTAMREMSIRIQNPWLYVDTQGLPSHVVGTEYGHTLEARGGDGTYAWSILDGTLPVGLELSTVGTISGTPTVAGESTFTVHVASGGREATEGMSITIVSADLGLSFDADQFALIPAGTFQMGSTDGHSDERPVHTVNITEPLYMLKTEVTQAQWRAVKVLKTEVTQAQWRAVMGRNPASHQNCGETCPVELVTWNNVQTFIQVLNEADSAWYYRLPSEAEWEYAARAGTTGDYGGTGDQ